MSDQHPGSTLHFSLHIQSDPRAIATARRLVRSLEGWADDETLARAELIASEIVTNAIRHGSEPGSGAVEVEIDATPVTLFVRVRDCGPPFALTDHVPRPGDVGGFGLHIARGLADSLTVQRQGEGNEVRFTVSAAPSETLR